MNILIERHHPVFRDICKIIHNYTNTEASSYHLALISYYLAQMPAAMRVRVQTPHQDYIPVNTYAMVFADSGFGKGHAINIMENQLLAGFRTKYMEETLPVLTEIAIQERALNLQVLNNESEEACRMTVQKEIEALGPYTFLFDSGTSPALKQLRQRLLMTKTGSLNLRMDEMGSHLEENNSLLQVFLELYDKGFTSVKLIKEAQGQKRYSHMEGATPANMLLFGTPIRVFDGGSTEKLFKEMLETGYARRTLFGIGGEYETPNPDQAEEYYENIVSSTQEHLLERWGALFTDLADYSNHGCKIGLPKETAIRLLEYRFKCEGEAKEFSEYRAIEKAEMNHRYFKALKMAGTLSFIEGYEEVSKECLEYAINLVEDCAKALNRLMHQDAPYIKLARYLEQQPQSQTHSDMAEALPWYPKSMTSKNEMLDMASAWGYKNGIIIKKEILEGIPFYNAEGLRKTELDSLYVSYSTDMTQGYVEDRITWEQLQTLVQTPGYHWCNHWFKDGYRKEDNVKQGFNLLVLDFDGGVSPEAIKEHLEGYQWILNFTKRNTPEVPRFRLILPIRYAHKLDGDEYKNFMGAVFGWLPFDVDTSGNHRSKKWLTSPKGVITNTGEILDSLIFMPSTKRGGEFQTHQRKIASFPKLERWIINHMETGDRNNILYRYARTLLGEGYTQAQIKSRILSINAQATSPLSDSELNSTIFKSIKQKEKDINNEQ